MQDEGRNTMPTTLELIGAVLFLLEVFACVVMGLAM